MILLVDGAGALPAPKRPAVQMPDEYLPPNKILFLQNLPESVTKDQLLGLFSQYALSFLYHAVYKLMLHYADIQTFTKCVLFRQRRTLPSWSSWTRGVRPWPRMLSTTTSSTARTRSKCVLPIVYSPTLTDSLLRSRSRGNRLSWVFPLCTAPALYCTSLYYPACWHGVY